MMGWFCAAAVLGAPSSRNSFVLPGAPLIEMDAVLMMSTGTSFIPRAVRTPGTKRA